jgi:hypothetical protein
MREIGSDIESTSHQGWLTQKTIFLRSYPTVFDINIWPTDSRYWRAGGAFCFKNGNVLEVSKFAKAINCPWSHLTDSLRYALKTYTLGKCPFIPFPWWGTLVWNGRTKTLNFRFRLFCWFRPTDWDFGMKSASRFKSNDDRKTEVVPFILLAYYSFPLYATLMISRQNACQVGNRAIYTQVVMDEIIF